MPTPKPKPETNKIIAEDALNLELKYLDENIRPFLLEMDKAYASYIMGGSPLPIIAYGIAGINAVIRVNRFEIIEIENFRKGFNKARQCINPHGGVANKGFDKSIVDAMDAFGYKIGKVHLYSRPAEEQRESMFSKFLNESNEEQKADAKKKRKVRDTDGSKPSGPD